MTQITRTRCASLAFATVLALTSVFAAAAHATGGLKVNVVSEVDDFTTCTITLEAKWHPKHGQEVLNFALVDQGGSRNVVNQPESILPNDSVKTEQFVLS